MKSDFILIEGKPENRLFVTNFSALGELHEFLVRRYFRELKKEYGEGATKQIIIDGMNRAIASQSCKI